MEHSFGINENNFEDEESKLIFRYRKNYYETGDDKWILRLVCKNHNTWADRVNTINLRIEEKIRNARGKGIIFGSGFNATRFYEALEIRNLSDQIIRVIDNDPQKNGQIFFNIPICSPKLENVDYSYIFIPYGGFSGIMYQQLLRMGVPLEKVVSVPETFCDAYKLKQRDDLEDIFMNENNHFFLYASTRGMRFQELLRRSGVHIDFVVKESQNISDDFSYILSNGSPWYAICFSEYSKNVLLSQGVDEKKIIHLLNIDGMIQYFDPTILPEHKEGKKEVFVDGGCLDLRSSEYFQMWCKNECRRIVAFEADRRSIEEYMNPVLRQNSALQDVTQVVGKGLWSREGVLEFGFTPDHASTFSVDARGKVNINGTNYQRIDVTSIDNVMNGDEVTFIKMDIEGAEMEALQGARKTIDKWHPILAISVYHKANDIMELPGMIRDIYEGYKLYLRMYHEDNTEVVLYAFPN